MQGIGGVGEFKVVNNLDWYRDMNALDFLIDVGRFARVGTMMSRERYMRVETW